MTFETPPIREHGDLRIRGVFCVLAPIDYYEYN